jgi:phosphate-selective porin OprO/OprP
MPRNVLITALLTLAPLAGASAQHLEWRDRPSLDAGPLRLELRAQGLTDWRASAIDLESSDTARFDTARRRVGVSGTLGSRLDFQIERELSGGGWKDLYASYRLDGALQIQGGQFKVPFGLDENTSSSRLDFVYRSRAATELAPGRAAGAMAHGRLGMVRYEAGVFDQGLTAGRAVVQPLRKRASRFEDLQAGIAYSRSRLDEGVSNLRGDTALGRRFFAPQFLVRGTRHRLGTELRWRPGPFSVQSELVRVIDERHGQSTANADLPPVAATAWYLQGSWLLTGERKTKGADVPRRPLLGGGIGSIELAGRVESLAFGRSGADAVIAPRAESVPRHADTAVTVGVNWSPNRWVRVQANVVREHIVTPSGSAWSGPPILWSRIVRVRLAL